MRKDFLSHRRESRLPNWVRGSLKEGESFNKPLAVLPGFLPTLVGGSLGGCRVACQPLAISGMAIPSPLACRLTGQEPSALAFRTGPRGSIVFTDERSNTKPYRLVMIGPELPSFVGCPTFWHLWVTLEEELSWTTH